MIFFYQFRLGDGLAMLACVMLISVFIAHVTHQLVERPLREVGRRLAERVAQAGPANHVRSLVTEVAV